MSTKSKNWTIVSVPANARSRKSFRSSTCVCCGNTIDHEQEQMIKQVEAESPASGRVKVKWVHESCADAFEAGEKPSVDPGAVKAAQKMTSGAPVEPAGPVASPATHAGLKQSADKQQKAFEALLQLMSSNNLDEARINEIVANATSAAMVPVCEEIDRVATGLREVQKTVAEMQPKQITIQVGDKPEIELPAGELVHPVFEKALQLAQARKNIMLVGPTGSGKTHLAQQIANALELKFAFISCSAGMSEGQLLGRLLPVGSDGKFEYVTSEFVDCYENGGVFAFDEFDAADSNVLLVVNAALANGQLSVPNRPSKPIAKKHKDFVCIACANTFGTGADRKYVGRARLDEATIERFRVGTLFMDYDVELEKALCPNVDLRNHLTKYRQAVTDQRIERVVSTRFMRDAAEMVEMGWSFEEIDSALFSGWKESEVELIKNYAKSL